VGVLLTYHFAPFVGLPLFGTYILFYLAFHPRLKLHNFGRYGDMSYGIYLYAWPIQQLVLQHLGGGLGKNKVSRLILCAMVLLLTCGMALLSWHAVEKPVLDFVRRKGKKASGKTEATPLPAPVALEAGARQAV